MSPYSSFIFNAPLSNHQSLQLVSNQSCAFPTTRITTGLSRYTRQLHQALQRIGTDIELVGTKLPPIPDIIKRACKSSGFDLATFFRTYPILLPTITTSHHRTEKPSLIHLTSQNQASALAFGAHKQVVVTVHDLITLAYRDQAELTGYMTYYDRFFENLVKRGLEKASALIADSEHTRQDIIRTLNYPADKISVVYLGIDQARFQPRKVSDDFYQTYHLDRQASYLLYVGSEDPRKNLSRLIDSLRRIVDQEPNIKLLKVGAARFVGERKQLQQKIQRLGLEDHVIFFDQVPDKDLACFYNIADLFVFPSLYEGFGLPVLEAMACGTPVLTSNRSSLPEVAGEAAILVNPYNVNAITHGIIQLLSDSTLADSMRQKGLTYAGQFTWERTARETMAVYERVLAESDLT